MTGIRPAALVLEDGTVIRGRHFGAEGTIFGELVFTTSMTGYQEALTDPSYNGQILLMTYPLIGNYGIALDHVESGRIQAEGFVVREACHEPSHRTSVMTVAEFLEQNGIPGIEGVDTRALTIRTRERGTMRAAILGPVGDQAEIDEALRKVQGMPFPDSENLVAEVSTTRTVRHAPLELAGPHPLRFVLVDCGVKQSIIRNLRRYGEVVQVPYQTSPEEILALKPDGLAISNGPGDPAHPAIVSTTVKNIAGLVGELPILGICLGHQILSQVFGGKTFKLKFGHRGSNQPVREVRTHTVRITSQNHGFAVSPGSLGSETEVSEENVNDLTVEGFRHTELPIISRQYHPEGSPGPWDSLTVFASFARVVKDVRDGKPLPAAEG